MGIHLDRHLVHPSAVSLDLQRPVERRSQRAGAGLEGACCAPCLRARRRLAHRRLLLALAQISPAHLDGEVLWMGSSSKGQVTGMRIASRTKSSDDVARYTIQVRQLYMAPIGHHEDVCVHDTCYTTGPSEGIYRRDPAASRWALTDADGWSTLPGWSFNVTRSQLDACRSYMDNGVVGNVTRNNFLANLWEYYSNGFCVTFSRMHFNAMANMVGG